MKWHLMDLMDLMDVVVDGFGEVVGVKSAFRLVARMPWF